MRLAADANVLLAAVLGGQANRVLFHPRVEEVFTTEPTLTEVHRYVPVLARKRNLPLDLLLLKLAAQPVTVVSPAAYRGSVVEARRRIARRDPDDVELLALALHMRIPVWSHDEDFADAAIEWYTTAQLLRTLVVPHALPI